SDERSAERVQRAGEDVREAGQVPVAGQLRVAEPVAAPGGVGEQLADRGRLGGARSRGASPSKPSSTCSSPKSGTIDATSSSRPSRPDSISRNAATVTSGLVMEAIRKTVSPVTGRFSPATRLPAPPIYSSPSGSVTTAANPAAIPRLTAPESTSSSCPPS